MLDLIRKKQKSVIIKVVFWGIIATFIGTIFLVWGKGSDDSGAGASGPVAATVNGAMISSQAYQTYLSNLYDQLQGLYGSNIPEALLKQFNLEEKSLNDLIDRELMRQEAARRDIEVSRQEVVDSIAAIPVITSYSIHYTKLYDAGLAGDPDSRHPAQRPGAVRLVDHRLEPLAYRRENLLRNNFV